VLFCEIVYRPVPMNTSPNWREVIDSICESYGIKEVELAKRCETTQATINRIRNGVIISPRYELGACLMGLYEARSQ